MAYTQNNPFSRKISPLNNGDKLDLTKIKSKRYFVRPIGDDERYDTENITNKKISERSGEVLVANKSGGRGARVDYLPAQETLTHGVNDQYQVSNKIYNTARSMMSDSLDLVNRGRGVKAANIYGPNLGQNLRQSTSSGNFEARVKKNILGIDDEKNIVAARAMKSRGGSGHGYDISSGESHVDFDSRTGHILPSKDLKSYRRKKGFIN